MSYGIRQEYLVEELKSVGYETTLKAFRNYLCRARAWRRKQEKANATPGAAPPAAQQSAVQPAGQHGFDYQGTPDDDELSDLI